MYLQLQYQFDEENISSNFLESLRWYVQKLNVNFV